MLTRALLLLLAMMTGLSAAQAAERGRPAHGVAGASAAVAQTLTVAAEIQAKRQASSFVLVECEGWSAGPNLLQVVLAAAVAPFAPRTYRSDRARE